MDRLLSLVNEAALDEASQRPCDVGLPRLNGVTATRLIRKGSPRTRVLLFTMHEDEETVYEALAAGARGYLLKTEGDQQLEEAITALGAGRPYFSSAVTQFLLDASLTERKRSLLESFTTRELEVAQLIAEGYSNKSIARQLAIEWSNRKRLAPGVSTPAIDGLIARATAAGAGAAKVCGAGGGGCLVTMAPPDRTAAIAEALAAGGARLLDFRIETDGLRVG